MWPNHWNRHDWTCHISIRKNLAWRNWICQRKLCAFDKDQKQWRKRWGAGVQAHHQQFWFLKNPDNIFDNWSKIPENTGKNGNQRCLTSKNGANFFRKTNKDLLWRSHQKESSWSWWEKIRRQKSQENISGYLWGNSGKNSSHPSKFACSCTYDWKVSSIPLAFAGSAAHRMEQQ